MKWVDLYWAYEGQIALRAINKGAPHQKRLTYNADVNNLFDNHSSLVTAFISPEECSLLPHIKHNVTSNLQWTSSFQYTPNPGSPSDLNKLLMARLSSLFENRQTNQVGGRLRYKRPKQIFFTVPTSDNDRNLSDQ